MAKYRATVRVLNVEAKNHALAQQTVEERLKAAGLDGWRIVSIEEDAKKPAPAIVRAVRRKAAPQVNSGTALLLAAAALAILFFLSLAL